MAPILRALRVRGDVDATLIHSGQHYSPEMSELFFRELELPPPDVNLEAGGGSHTVQTAEIMKRLEPVFERQRPDAVVVVGDVNSTLAAALVASKMGIPVAHVEAGLRSFDRTMPEEINRVVTDVVSEWLFASEPSGVANLVAEGIPRSRIFLVGNVMIDSLMTVRQKSRQSDVLERLGLTPGSYALVTMHRPSNVDDPARLRAMLEMLAQAASLLPVVFPVHPRTRERIERSGGAWKPPRDLQLIPPLGYLDFVRLMSEARVVVSDSGGVQEETTVLQTPCLTMRDNTERPITIEQGTNQLVGANPGEALRRLREVLDGERPPSRIPELWDGKASERVVEILMQQIRARLG